MSDMRKDPVYIYVALAKREEDAETGVTRFWVDKHTFMTDATLIVLPDGTETTLGELASRDDNKG